MLTDHDVAFEPQIATKGQPRHSRVTEVVFTRHPEEPSTGEIPTHSAEINHPPMLKKATSRITDNNIEKTNNRSVHPLDEKMSNPNCVVSMRVSPKWQA